MPDYTITTIESDGSEGISSQMTRAKAVSFARGMLADGIRVVRIEAVDGSETMDEDEVRRVISSRDK